MLKLENISKKLGDFTLSGISMEIREGEYYVLLGRSGSGKTQLLELIAGLNDPDSGKIWLDDEDITFKKIQSRNIGLVFQDYAIFPNLTVFGNIAYSLHCRKNDKSTIKNEVTSIAKELNIGHLLTRFTHNLSGGELQRVALARTLITSPRLLLLDEPLASIDASLKDDIKKTFRQLNKKGLTIIHVTHDYSEAVSLATRIGVIHNGRVIQEGSPDDVFGKPANKFVARYAGIRNFFRVRFIKEGLLWKALSDTKLALNLPEGNYPDEGLVIIRNNAIIVAGEEPQQKAGNCFKGVVKDISPCEQGMELLVEAAELFYIEVPMNDFKKLQITETSDVWISFPSEACIVLNGGSV